jgi:hypothetical protein
VAEFRGGETQTRKERKSSEAALNEGKRTRGEREGVESDLTTRWQRVPACQRLHRCDGQKGQGERGRSAIEMRRGGKSPLVTERGEEKRREQRGERQRDTQRKRKERKKKNKERETIGLLNIKEERERIN